MAHVHIMSCPKVRFSVPRRCAAPTARFTKPSFMRNYIPMNRMSSSIQMPTLTQKFQIRSFSTVRPIKGTTGFTSLAVAPNWKQDLITLYNQLLRDLELLPENTVWRQMYEKITRYRLKIVEQEDDWLKVEELIQGGPVEMLIQQAKQDLECIPKLLELKPWDFDRDTHSVPIIQLVPKE